MAGRHLAARAQEVVQRAVHLDHAARAGALVEPVDVDRHDHGAFQHALEREQFGRPIASFQAVRHKLAETLVYIESADALLVDAWDDGSPHYAAMAKAFAGYAARIAAKHCQQVLAGIGFTTEHPFHLYLTRVLELDRKLGTGKELTRAIGAQLLQTQQLPAPVPL